MTTEMSILYYVCFAIIPLLLAFIGQPGVGKRTVFWAVFIEVWLPLLVMQAVVDLASEEFLDMMLVMRFIAMQGCAALAVVSILPGWCLKYCGAMFVILCAMFFVFPTVALVRLEDSTVDRTSVLWYYVRGTTPFLWSTVLLGLGAVVFFVVFCVIVNHKATKGGFNSTEEAFHYLFFPFVFFLYHTLVLLSMFKIESQRWLLVIWSLVWASSGRFFEEEVMQNLGLLSTKNRPLQLKKNVTV